MVNRQYIQLEITIEIQQKNMNTSKQREHKVDTPRQPTLIVLEPSSNQPRLMMRGGMGLQGLNPRPPVMSPSQSTLPLTMSSDCNLDTPTMLGKTVSTNS